jgi:hypothetical protein
LGPRSKRDSDWNSTSRAFHLGDAQGPSRSSTHLPSTQI